MTWVKIGTAGKRTVKLHDDMRATHMHVLGISGQGKSYFLEGLIREDILEGHGVCVIDPHGELYDNLVRWLSAHNLHKTRKIHLLNPSDDTYTFGWNPLAVDNGCDISVRVDSMVDACVKVWGGKDARETPRLRKCLKSVFYALAHHQLSLAEQHILTSAHNRPARQFMTQVLGNAEVENIWREFDEALNYQKFMEYFESSVSRLMSFLSNPRIRAIVGQTENLINFRECMDEGHIVLVNLSRTGKMSREASQLIGALLVNDMYTTATGRDVKTAKKRPFYAYIDECADYITDDIASSLDETRKFGLHLILSHQRLYQLKRYGDDLYNAVMANAQTKVVFKVNDEDTAETMAKHLFRKEFNLEKPKRVLDKPVVVGYRPRWLDNESEGITHITGSSESFASGLAEAAGLIQSYDRQGQQVGGYTETAVDASSSIEGHSSFEATANSKNAGRSQTLEPELKVMPTATYNLDELTHEAMVKLLALPKQHAFLYSPTQRPVRFSTTFIRPGIVLESDVEKAIGEINQKSAFTSPRLQVEEKIIARADALSAKPDRLVTARLDDSDDDMLS